MSNESTANNFIEEIIEADLAAGRRTEVVTRFPPEPNGYLHIGHAKSTHLNFGLARKYQGRCHLRFDDTNPLTEDTHYAEAIQRDLRWLGFEWEPHFYHASDYFERMYGFAQTLIKKGKAYVCSQTVEQMRETRGSLGVAGTPSPDRERSVDENLDLFARMRAGEFADGELTLRAKIDMAASNMKMRDPALYRIRKAHHHRTGDEWCIYPMYDFAHCLSDAIESITYSICTLEFENNRELYDWILAEVGFENPPRQYEFARLGLNYTVMSKRKFLKLVGENHVNGWDDPRMPTIAGLRRRGYTPEAIAEFCERIGIAKNNSTVDMGLLEFAIRQDLEHRAPRVMAVLEPLKVTITNFPDGEVEQFEAPFFPPEMENEDTSTRSLPFSRTLYIEREDFDEEPPEGYRRLAPGREVRLRYAYYVTCNEVVKAADGTITELRCTYDPDTRGGTSADGRKVSGTLHWVSAEQSLPAEVRLYDRLFTVPKPDADPDGRDFLEFLNPDSLVVCTTARVEPGIRGATHGDRFQFERLGYFAVDPDSAADALVFNRTVGLKDAWAGASVDVNAEREAARRRREEARAAAAPAKAAEPENPEEARRLMDQYGLGDDDARVISDDAERTAFFEVAARWADNTAVARWLVNTLLGEVKERPLSELPFDGAAFGRLVDITERGVCTATSARTVLSVMLETGGEPAEIVAERGLEAVDDTDAVKQSIADVLAQHPDELERYRGGEKKLMGFFMGLAMRATAGKADPKTVSSILREQLG